MTGFLLSICIPTYNRLDSLLINLTHLLPQIHVYKDEVELIISDNFSPIDPCSDIVDIGNNFGVSINYYRQKENIGVDNNIDFVVEKSKGDYIFILGDDDILSPSFLDIIIPLLRSHKYGAIHFGRLIGDAECSNNKLHNPFYKDSVLELSADVFIKECVSSPNLLSSIIVDKSCWDKGTPYEKKEYYGYGWFANYYFGIIELSKPCIYYYFPLLIMRSPIRGWSKYWPVYSIVGLSNIFKDIDKKVPGVYQDWMARLHNKRFYNINIILSQVYVDKSYYREKRKEFYPHLTKKEKRVLNYWLYTPIPKLSDLTCTIFRRFLRVFKV